MIFLRKQVAKNSHTLILIVILSILLPVVGWGFLVVGLRLGIMIWGKDAFILGYNDYSLDEAEEFLGVQVPSDATNVELTSYTYEGILIYLSFDTSPANATVFTRDLCLSFKSGINPLFPEPRVYGIYEGSTCSKNGIFYRIVVDQNNTQYTVILEAEDLRK